MLTREDAAKTIEAGLLAKIEDALTLWSDMYKEVNGFRPRGFSWERAIAAPADALDRLECAIKSLSRENAETIAREKAEREDFKAKVAALGLNPAHFMDLAD